MAHISHSTSTPAMLRALQAQWQTRSPRERRLLSITSALLLAGLLTWLLISAYHSSRALRVSLPVLRVQAQTLEQHAYDIEQLRLLPAPATTHTRLLPLLQDLVVIAGLSDSAPVLEALDSHRVTVAFGAISFPLWVDWLNTLSQQGIRVESITMETLLTPGLVSTQATLQRAGTP
jgi:type II secretory pathway component PulM